MNLKIPVAVPSVLTLVFSSSLAAENEILLPSMVIIGEQTPYIQLSETATKTDQDLLDTPLSVNIVNQAFIQDLQAETLADVYPYIVGLSQSGTNANNFTLRGLSSDLQNVQIDGLPGLASRFGSPSTANIESVEVLKGPASVLYGLMQPGGLVNIVTKKPQIEQMSSVSFSGRSFASEDSNFGSDLGVTLTFDSTGALTEGNKLAYRFIGSVENIDSFRDDVNYNNIYLYPTLSYQLSSAITTTIGMEYVKEQGDADDGLVAVKNDIKLTSSRNTHYQENDDFDNDEGLVFFGRLENQLSQATLLKINIRSVFHEDERKLYENNLVNDEENVLDSTLRRRDRHQLNKREYHFLDVNLSHKFTTGTLFHNTIFGINGGFERADFERIRFGAAITPNMSIFNPQYNEAIPSSIRAGNHRVTDYYNYGIYAQDTIDLNNYVSLMLGGRYDRQRVEFEEKVSNFNDTQSTGSFIPQGGIVFKLNEKISLYASHSQSFNPNSIEQRAADNSSFDPETGEQNEIGAKAALLSERLNITFASYDINKRNIVEQNINGDNELIGELESTGVELEVQALPIDNWQIRVGYANNDSIVSSGPNPELIGQTNAFAPRENAFIWTRYNLAKKHLGGNWGVSLGVNYKSEQFTSSDPSKRVALPTYTRMDSGFYFDIKPYHIALNVENIFDETYYTGGTNDTKIYPGNPRLITLSFKADI